MYTMKFNHKNLSQIALAISCAILVIASALIVNTIFCFRVVKTGINLLYISYNISLIEEDASKSPYSWTDHLQEEYDKCIEQRNELINSDDKIESLVAKSSNFVRFSILLAFCIVKAILAHALYTLAKFELRIMNLAQKAKKI